MDRMEKAWNLYERLLDVLGAESVLSSLVQYLSVDDLEDYMQTMARENDLEELYEEEEDYE